MLELVGARGFGEIDVEHEIEPERLPDLGLVRHHAVIGVQHQPVDENRVAHRARLIAAATASACTVGATSCTRTIAAPFSTARRCAASEPPSRSIGSDGVTRMDEALARSADQERQAEAAPGVEPGDAGHALLRRLAEADAGIEHDALARDAGARGDFERAREERGHVGDDVDRRIGALAIVHDDDRRAALGDDARHVGIALQAPDVVDDRGAQLERPGGDRRL